MSEGKFTGASPLQTPGLFRHLAEGMAASRRHGTRTDRTTRVSTRASRRTKDSPRTRGSRHTPASRHIRTRLRTQGSLRTQASLRTRTQGRLRTRGSLTQDHRRTRVSLSGRLQDSSPTLAQVTETATALSRHDAGNGTGPATSSLA